MQPPTEKQCSKCGDPKPLAQFYPGKNRCMDCAREYQQNYNEINKEKIKLYKKEYYRLYK